MVSLNPSRFSAPTPGFGCVRRAPSLQFRADPHAGIELCFVPAGWITFQLGGETVRVSAGEVAVLWAATPHQIVAHSEKTNAYFVASLPLAWFVACRLPPAFAQTLLQGRLVVGATDANAALDAERFANWEQDAGDGDSEISLAILLELKARLLRLALGGEASPASRLAATGRTTKVDLIADLVARRCTGEVNAQVIAKELALAPKQVGALFNRIYGTSLGEFITCHRIFHAQRLLVTSRARVAAIAAAAGFGSLSRFNSAFRKACGCSPRDFRQLNDAGGAVDDARG